MSIHLQESEDFAEILKYSTCYLGGEPSPGEYRALKSWLEDHPEMSALTKISELDALHAFLQALRPVPVPGMGAVALAATKAKITGLLSSLSDILGRTEVRPSPADQAPGAEHPKED